MAHKGSPTLIPGHNYLSVVVPVPVELCQKISTWNSQFGQEAATIGNHITVLITEVTDNFEAAKALGAADLKLCPIKVELGSPQTFLPATPVTYLPLTQGVTELTSAHHALQDVLGESVSPFDYVPHLTLSHRLAENQLSEAQEFFESLPKDLRKFMVESFQVYSNVEGIWEHLVEIPLSTAKSEC